MDELEKQRLTDGIVSRYRNKLEQKKETPWIWEKGTDIQRERYMNAEALYYLIRGGKSPRYTFDPTLKDRGYDYFICTGSDYKINLDYVVYG